MTISFDFEQPCIDDVELSPRQLEVIRLRSRGMINKQIAAYLNISECTVKEHITLTLRKTSCRTVEQAILSLARNGVLS